MANDLQGANGWRNRPTSEEMGSLESSIYRLRNSAVKMQASDDAKESAMTMESVDKLFADIDALKTEDEIRSALDALIKDATNGKSGQTVMVIMYKLMDRYFDQSLSDSYRLCVESALNEIHEYVDRCCWI